ncbi:MAG: nuclear transport factor 2 family protein [Bacteroidetes bacterium]|nr:nuclear transport factor 2 family protein [Bacteroidota bacterium]
MKYCLHTLAIFLTAITAGVAQSAAEKEAIMKPVTLLFAAMQKGDSAMLRKAFASDVTMATIGRDKNGKTFIQHESSIKDFQKAIGTPHAETYNEMIWGEKILVDGDFAQVWTSYAFYLGKKFSHCGVDAFNLVRENGEWKIFHLADTRQREGCSVPDHIKKLVE